MAIGCLAGGIMSALASETELLRVKGLMVEGGIVCPMFRSDDGTIFPLMRLSKNDHPIGTSLELRGTFVKKSMCQLGERAFNVEKVIGVDDY